MKQTGYLYHENGRIVFNPELKTCKFFFYDNDLCLKTFEYNKTLKQWNDNCLPVENTATSNSGIWYIEFCDKNGKLLPIKHIDAQKCLAEIEKKVTVIELI